MSDARVAIITGATGGIGGALARAFDARGYSLVLHGFGTEEAGKRLAAECTSAVYLDRELGAPEAAVDIAAIALESFGRVDVLLNNAGVGIPVPHSDLDAISSEFFDMMLAVNLKAPWFLVQACAEALRESRGNIINMSSMAASTVSGSSIPYAVSKAGLEHLTKLLAVAMGPEVRVNAIAPGLVDTERTREWADIRAAVEAAAPLRRSAAPEDIAQAALALLDAEYTTGVVLPVDGGQRLV